MNPFNTQQQRVRRRQRINTAVTSVLTNPPIRRRQRNGQRALGPNPPRVRGNEVIQRGIPGFSALRYKAKLSYFDTVASLSTGAGTAGTYVISANGLYDPDITSTGHQPMSFDQLMLSFEHYVVTRAQITVNFRNQNSTYNLGCAISLNAGPTPTTNYIQLVENGNLVRTRLQPLNATNSMEALVMPIDVAKFGAVDDLLDNPDYSGTIAANPTEQSYFHISVWNSFDTTVVACYLEFYVEFEAWFIEPRKNSVSLNQQIARLIKTEALYESKQR